MSKQKPLIYYFVPALLSLASQRAEFLVLEWSGVRWLQELVEYWKDHERGALPGIIEFTVVIYIASNFAFVGMVLILTWVFSIIT